MVLHLLLLLQVSIHTLQDFLHEVNSVISPEVTLLGKVLRKDNAHTQVSHRAEE